MDSETNYAFGENFCRSLARVLELCCPLTARYTHTTVKITEATRMHRCSVAGRRFESRLPDAAVGSSSEVSLRRRHLQAMTTRSTRLKRDTATRTPHQIQPLRVSLSIAMARQGHGSREKPLPSVHSALTFLLRNVSAE